MQVVLLEQGSCAEYDGKKMSEVRVCADAETLVCTQHQLDARLRHTWNDELNCELPPPAPPERIVIVPASSDIKAACDKIEAEGGKPKIFAWCHDKQGRELDRNLKVVPNGRVWK